MKQKINKHLSKKVTKIFEKSFNKYRVNIIEGQYLFYLCVYFVDLKFLI